jgi:hypothetical protein
MEWNRTNAEAESDGPSYARIISQGLGYSKRPQTNWADVRVAYGMQNC